MKLATLTLTVLLASSAIAQQQPTTATTTTNTTTSAPAPAQQNDELSEDRRYEVRNQFMQMLGDHSYDLTMLIRLDPSLLSSDTFVAKYPDLQAFLERHPEIRRNPRFYLATVPYPTRRDPLENVVEMLAILGGFSLAAFVLLWFIRTIIEQRRWNRLSRTQAEVHNKILDRFGSSEEVLAYMQTNAGTRFLESAPIPVQAETRPGQSAASPFGRVVWSIHLGVILAVAALGMVLLSFRFDGDDGHGFFALGVIIFSIGAGFIASAVVSLMMSRRLGLWLGPSENPRSADDVSNASPVR